MFNNLEFFWFPVYPLCDYEEGNIYWLYFTWCAFERLTPEQVDIDCEDVINCLTALPGFGDGTVLVVDWTDIVRVTPDFIQTLSFDCDTNTLALTDGWTVVLPTYSLSISEINGNLELLRDCDGNIEVVSSLDISTNPLVRNNLYVTDDWVDVTAQKYSRLNPYKTYDWINGVFNNILSWEDVVYEGSRISYNEVITLKDWVNYLLGDNTFLTLSDQWIFGVTRVHSPFANIVGASWVIPINITGASQLYATLNSIYSLEASAVSMNTIPGYVDLQVREGIVTNNSPQALMMDGGNASIALKNTWVTLANNPGFTWPDDAHARMVTSTDYFHCENNFFIAGQGVQYAFTGAGQLYVVGVATVTWTLLKNKPINTTVQHLWWPVVYYPIEGNPQKNYIKYYSDWRFEASARISFAWVIPWTYVLDGASFQELINFNQFTQVTGWMIRHRNLTWVWASLAMRVQSTTPIDIYTATPLASLDWPANDLAVINILQETDWADNYLEIVVSGWTVTTGTIDIYLEGITTTP